MDSEGKLVKTSVGVSLDIVELLRARLRRLREPCVKAVLLFGSRARGEA